MYWNLVDQLQVRRYMFASRSARDEDVETRLQDFLNAPLPESIRGIQDWA